MVGPEGRVEEYLREYFSQRGWLVYKCAWGGGAADRLLISPRGFHLYVELKRPGKDKLDAAQVAWGNELANRVLAGKRHLDVAIVGPINSRDGVRALYEQYRDC